jgi:hypothetical protein
MAEHQYKTTIGVVEPIMAKPSTLALKAVVITSIAAATNNTLIAVTATVN